MLQNFTKGLTETTLLPEKEVFTTNWHTVLSPDLF